MGPRSDDRGNFAHLLHEHTKAIVLQWGRGLTTAEIDPFLTRVTLSVNPHFASGSDFGAYSPHLNALCSSIFMHKLLIFNNNERVP